MREESLIHREVFSILLIKMLKFYLKSNRHYNDRCLCLRMLLHLNVLLVLLISISVYKVHRVDSTILAPKARICFNSMSTSFQSECVYCDSRLYASTITACTGQPMLANNVTQAQAFCIATACLQVPVLKKTEPFMVANDLYEHSTNKLDLFRPSVLFGLTGLAKHIGTKANYNNKNNKHNGFMLANHRSPTYLLSSYPQSRFKRSTKIEQQQPIRNEHKVTLTKRPVLNGERQKSRKSLIPRDNDQHNIRFIPKLQDDQATSVPPKLETSAQNSPPEPVSPEVPSPPVTTSAAASADSNTSDTTTTEPPPSVVMATEETKSFEYPNFNQVYSQIYNSMAEQKRPLIWRPPEYKENSFYSKQPDKLNQQQPMGNIKIAANRVANLMHSVSNNLAIKKANLLNSWYNNKNNNNMVFGSYPIGSRTDLFGLNNFKLYNSDWPSFKFNLKNYPKKRHHQHHHQYEEDPLFYPPSYVHTPTSLLINNDGQDDYYSLKQTGKTPTVLGKRRKKRALVAIRPLSLNLNKNKQLMTTNGTLTAQLNKSVNGTTTGNVAFVLNNPSSAYIWNNPLTRVLTRNNPNKSLQWQFGKGAATSAPAAAAAPPAAGQLANQQPPRQVFGVSQQQQQQPQQQQLPYDVSGSLQVSTPSTNHPLTASFVVPAARRQVG